MHVIEQRFERGQFPEGSEPPLIAFNAVIGAFARNGESEKAEEVLWLLGAVQSNCEILTPDVRTYNSVLHAHLKDTDKERSLQRALALVEYMEENAMNLPSIKPDSYTYNSLMKVGANENIGG